MNKKLLRNKNLLLLIFGNSTSIFGDIFLQIALSLYVLKLTGSAEKFGSILALSVIPRLVLAPVAGVLVDRFDKRRLAIFLDVLRIVFLSILLLSIYYRGLTLMHVYLTLLFFAACDIFFRPCFIALIPAIMNNENVVPANMMVRTSTQIASVIAPVLAAFFFNLYGLVFILIVDGVTYTVSVIAELFIRVKTTRHSTDGKNLHFFRDMADGIRVIFSNVQITSLVINGTLSHLFLLTFLTIGIPYLLVNVYGAPDVYYGMVESWTTMGTFLSIIFVSRARRTYSMGTNINIGIFGMAAVSLLFIIVTPGGISELFTLHNHYAVIFFCTVNFLMFLAFGFYGVFFSSFYQMNVPEGYLGRFVVIFQFCIALGRLAGFRMYGYLFERSVLMAVLVMITGVLLKIVVHIPFLQAEKKRH